VAPRGGGRRGSPESGEFADVLGRKRTGEGLQPLGTRFGWLVGPWERPPAAAAAGSAAARQVLAGAGKGATREGEGEVHVHNERTDPPLNSRHTPYNSGRTAGLPGASTAVRRRRAEHAAARPPRRLGARSLGACGLVSRASLRQGARPRSTGHRPDAKAARRARRRSAARCGPARCCPRRVGASTFDRVFPKIFESKCNMW
jgi:hypothetical protein